MVDTYAATHVLENESAAFPQFYQLMFSEIRHYYGVLTGKPGSGVSLFTEIQGRLSQDIIEANRGQLADVESKITTLNPRKFAVIASTHMLSDIEYNSHNDINRRPFYMFYLYGDFMDEFVDKLSIDTEETLEDFTLRMHSCLNLPVVKAVREVLLETIDKTSWEDKTKIDLKLLVNRWDNEFIAQEVSRARIKIDKFQQGRNYREEQNALAGDICIQMLLGDLKDTQDAKKIRELLPILSLPSQIMDDIGDYLEDSTNGNLKPTYVVTALEETNEGAGVRRYLEMNGRVKLRPEEFKLLAPNAYDLVWGAFNEYLERFTNEVPQNKKRVAKLLTNIAKRTYHHYPFVRDNLIFPLLGKRFAKF